MCTKSNHQNGCWRRSEMAHLGSSMSKTSGNISQLPGALTRNREALACRSKTGFRTLDFLTREHTKVQEPLPSSRDQQTTAQWAKCGWPPVLVNTVRCLHLHIVYGKKGSFLATCQSWVVTADTIWSTNPKIFNIWPFTEKVCWSLV